MSKKISAEAAYNNAFNVLEDLIGMAAIQERLAGKNLGEVGDNAAEARVAFEISKETEGEESSAWKRLALATSKLKPIRFIKDLGNWGTYEEFEAACN